MSVAPPVPRYRCRVPATSVNNGFFRRRCVGAPLGSGQLWTSIHVDFQLPTLDCLWMQRLQDQPIHTGNSYVPTSRL